MKIAHLRRLFEARHKKGWDGTDGCWRWTGFVNPDGYGELCTKVDGKQRCIRGHRLSYELVNGPIPPGKVVMHTCDRPLCVNPDHLRLGTFADNRRDCVHKKRHVRGVRHADARLNPVAVRVIRVLHGRGVSQVRLADAYGVGQTTISRVVRRQTWRSVQ